MSLRISTGALLVGAVVLSGCIDRPIGGGGEPPGCCYDVASGKQVRSCDGAPQCLCAPELCDQGGECKAAKDCPALGVPCQRCDDGSTACPVVDCVNGKCVATVNRCPGAQCKSADECPVPASCRICPDGTCVGYTARCVDGRCETSPGKCAAECRADMDCPPPPPVCQTCADGSQACAVAVCDQGQCATSFPACPPPPQCRKDTDCLQPPGQCERCPDGTVACPQAVCTAGVCQVIRPPCPPPQCRVDMDCPQVDLCEPCADGSCAVMRCVTGACQLVCPEPQCRVDNDCPEPDAPCKVCDDGSLSCPKGVCVNGVCQILWPQCPAPQCRVDKDCPQPKAPCKLCKDGSASCPSGRCINGQCTVVWPPCPEDRCGKVTCPAGQVCCNASCGICTPPGGGCIEVACKQTPVAGGCYRSSNDLCRLESDCRAGGCGGELCYNPNVSPGISDCNCTAPRDAGCGCVNGRCTWWK